MSRTRRVQSLRRSGGFFLALLAGMIAFSFTAGGALAQEYGPRSSGGGTLTRTGSSWTIPLTVLAVTLVLVGAAIVALLRRRHLQRPI